ncbi:putative Peptidase C14 caspase catalytic subunit p20 [uncultured spirochete]|jgi:Uncharacterized protein containing caspase domain|uniref:Putative Peptidase C14 caspase catalytic subunit p20 n=1 Tax=uncultured spirochete TaxID=156406 RepID=A0A3P3XFQ4_9SPIR|nr:caspase family protein [Rectinema subterraneum]SLM09789.1 putative Peptidase C14 caspase catalytic subunit p20 [uncultured spirochete]HCX97334.1 hypothetical protein [Spirochaetaceae bacterium]
MYFESGKALEQHRLKPVREKGALTMQRLRAKRHLSGIGSLVPLLVLSVILMLTGCELFPKSASSSPGVKYAIIVGINDYIYLPYGRNNDLSYCVADANSMKTMLEEAGWTVKLITAESNESTNRFATKSAIESALNNVPSDAESFMFYYSGHGSGGFDPGEAYIIPSDWDPRAFNFTDRMISTSEFASLLEKVPAKNKIVILDSCYSGGFVNPAESSDAVPGNVSSQQISSSIDMFLKFGELLALNAQYRSADASLAPLTISAAGWDEESWEQGSPIYHGLFTYYLLKAAEVNVEGRMPGDADGDNVLSCLEAYNYAKKALEKTNYRYLPHISGGLRDFALIDNRGN